MLVLVVLISSLATVAHGLVNCTRSGDGDFEVGCKVFVRCKGGESKTIQCPKEQVYNGNGSCDLITNVQLPCGTLKECAGKDDGHYADRDYGCHSFYTCSKGHNLGTNTCPFHLVFDDAKQFCNWRHSVAPPCGTNTTTTTAPTVNPNFIG